MTSSESGIPEAIEAVAAQHDTAQYMIIGLIVLLYIAIVTIMVVREYRLSPIHRDFEAVVLASAVIAIIGTIGTSLIITFGTGFFVSQEDEQRDEVVREHIEENIDGTVEYIGSFTVRGNHAKWVQEAEYVATVGMQLNGEVYPQDIVMIYHSTYDVMLPFDSDELSELPLIEGSQLDEMVKDYNMAELAETTAHDES